MKKTSVSKPSENKDFGFNKPNKPALGPPLKGSKNFSRYNWRKWCDGKPHKLKHGVDFFCKVDTFRLISKQWAKRNGVHVKVSIDSRSVPAVVTIQFN